MEKKRATPEILRGDKNTREKTGRITKSAKKQTGKTAEMESEISQSSSARKISGSITERTPTRRSARLSLPLKKQENCTDSKIENSDKKSPGKRKEKLMKLSEEVESSKSPRSKRTKSLAPETVEKDEGKKTVEKKSRKQKRQSGIREDNTQDQCSENLKEASDATNINDDHSALEDIGKKKSRRASERNKGDETKCDKVCVENSVSSDFVSPKDKKRKRSSKSKMEKNNDESPEKDTQENSDISEGVAEPPTVSPTKASSKKEKQKQKQAEDKTDGGNPVVSNKSSERTNETQISSSLKSSPEDKKTTSPTAEIVSVEKNVSDSEVTFISKRAIPLIKEHSKLQYDEVKIEDSSGSNDDIEITHIKTSKVKSSPDIPVQSGKGRKSVNDKVVLAKNSVEPEITFLVMKQKNLTAGELKGNETEIKEGEVDISDSEVKCLTPVSKGKGRSMKETNSLDVAMELEIKDEEESNSEITCLTQDSKIKKRTKEGKIDSSKEGGNENEDTLDISLPSKKSMQKGKACRESLLSEIKAGESFSKSPRKKTDIYDSPSCTKSSRFSKEGTSKFSNTDPVQEYNRSISEEITLLKPKAFAARRSDSFLRKVLDDQCDGSGAEEDSDAECRKAIMESAQRRIEQNVSTSESDSRLFRGLHPAKPGTSKDDVSSDSGSAPEVLSFETARKQTADSIKNVNEHIKRERQKLKEKRKARLELLKQQKEQKLIRLKEKMASQEDASCSSSEESGYEEELRNARLKMKKKKKTKPIEGPTEKENLDEPVPGTASQPQAQPPSDDTSEQEFIGSKEAMSLNSLKRMQADLHKGPEEPVPAKISKVSINNGANQEEKIKKKKLKDDKKPGFNSLTNLDYIPLNVEGSTKFMVVPLEKTAHLSLAEEAKKFRDESLYRWNMREPATENAVVRRKKRAAMKNAVKNRYK